MNIIITGPSGRAHNWVNAMHQMFDTYPIFLQNTTNTDIIDAVVSRADGVIISGGTDIHPKWYGRAVTKNSRLTRFDMERDVMEVAAFNAAMELGIPVLGVCRGLQLISAIHGVEIIKDLGYTEVSHAPNRDEIALSIDEPAHTVRFEDGRNAPKSYRYVNSFHHQGIKPPAANSVEYEVVATANADPISRNGVKHTGNGRIVEIAKCPDNRWYGTQFHPEIDFEYNQLSKDIFTTFRNMIEGGNDELGL
jgi:putative glutamine amidotransferase